MTERFLERKGEEMPIEALYPNSARQKRVVASMIRILKKSGISEALANTLALELWRVTRR